MNLRSSTGYSFFIAKNPSPVVELPLKKGSSKGRKAFYNIGKKSKYL